MTTYMILWYLQYLLSVTSVKKTEFYVNKVKPLRSKLNTFCCQILNNSFTCSINIVYEIAANFARIEGPLDAIRFSVSIQVNLSDYTNISRPIDPLTSPELFKHCFLFHSSPDEAEHRRLASDWMSWAAQRHDLVLIV